MAGSRHLVGVVWRDAHGSSLAEFAEHEIPHRAFIWTTYGLLMRDDAEGISIANEVSEGSFRGITFVPREMVVEVIDLGVPRRRRKARKRASSAAGAAAAVVTAGPAVADRAAAMPAASGPATAGMATAVAPAPASPGVPAPPRDPGAAAGAVTVAASSGSSAGTRRG